MGLLYVGTMNVKY